MSPSKQRKVSEYQLLQQLRKKSNAVSVYSAEQVEASARAAAALHRQQAAGNYCRPPGAATVSVVPTSGQRRQKDVSRTKSTARHVWTEATSNWYSTAERHAYELGSYVATKPLAAPDGGAFHAYSERHAARRRG